MNNSCNYLYYCCIFRNGSEMFDGKQKWFWFAVVMYNDNSNVGGEGMNNQNI